MYKGYTVSKFYWEFVIIYRKLLIIVVATFLSHIVKMVQALIALSILVLFLMLHHRNCPYNRSYLNTMEHRSLLVSIATLFLGLFYLDESLGKASEYLCFALILAFNLYFLQFLLSKLTATYFVMLVKRMPWLQQHFVVVDEARAVSYSAFRRKVLPTKPSQPLLLSTKKNYLRKLQMQ